LLSAEELLSMVIRKFFSFIFFACFVFSQGAAQAATGHRINSYPARNSRNVNAATSVGITYSEPLDESSLISDSIRVIGSKFGIYSGSLTLSVNARTLIFKPSHPFLRGEHISVYYGSIQLRHEGATEPEAFSFTTASNPPPARLNNPEKTNQLLSIPDTGDLPKITVTKNVKPYPGELYFSNIFDPNGIGYRIKVGTDGKITFAKRMNTGFATDYKPNPNGTYSWVSYWAGKVYIADTSDKIIDSLSGKNGYPLDIHEFRFTPEGNYMFIADDVVDTDMSQIIPGANAHAAVTFPVIQELDKEHNLIFEWNSKDYFTILDGTHQNFLAGSIDFCHMNSIDFDADSNLLVSNRNMDELTKIDRHTGQIIWRMGGNNNQFTFLGDKYGFSGQHHFRRLPNGNYTGFDDGNFRPGPLPFSRAIEYKLDEENLTATEVWEFRRKPDRFASGMGSVQRLPNGNTLIGWGFADTVGATEVDSLGNIQFELNFGTGTHSYRVYKFDTNYIHTSSRSGIISAGDIDFGKVKIGDTAWQSLQIKNLGLSAFTIVNAHLDTNNFSIDPKTKFPLEVKAGNSATVSLSFHPQVILAYSDSMSWSTDIPELPGRVSKDRSVLNGEGIENSGVKSSAPENIFSIHPNPSNGSSLITITLPKENSTVRLFDILGKEVYKSEISGQTELQIPIRDLPNGTYYIRMTWASETTEGSFVKAD
jgi:hypothetical protein